MGQSTQGDGSTRIRVRVFVDFWNFQLTLNDREAREQGNPQARFFIDWTRVAESLVQMAADKASIADPAYDGMNVYTSFDPNTSEGRKHRQWATTWLDRQPGVHV